MKKLTLILMALSVLSIFLAGCNQGAGGDTSSTAGKDGTATAGTTAGETKTTAGEEGK